MRHYLFDILGLAGFGALTYGLFLRFGLADALIAAGSLLLVLAIFGARAAKRWGGKA
ncbi:MAG: hypothetical protein VX796_16490 [Pseudomonadota bacterium]|nr:hypothetical protein [Pseudomonadota bacterium]